MTKLPDRRLALGPILGIGLALWLCAPAFGPRPPAGEDVMAHLVRADFAIPHLVAHGRLDGWFPRFVLGHQEFLFNGPGLTWLMAVVRGVTLGTLSNPGALKVVAIAAVAAVPPAAWFLARSYGLSRPAAGLGAVLALAVDNPFGLGLRGTFETGLVPHQVGAALFCLALGAFLRLVVDPRRRWMVLAATALAGLVVTHVISALVLAVVLALTLTVLAPELGRPALGGLAAAGVAAAGLAAFWLVPFLAHWDLHGVVTSWGVPPLGRRLGEILRGDILFGPGMVPILVAGWLFALRPGVGKGPHAPEEPGVGAPGGQAKPQRQSPPRRPALVALAVVPLAYVVLGHLAFALLGSNPVTIQLANRGLGYAGLLAVLPLAALLEALGRRLGRVGPMVVLALSALVVLGPPGPNRSLARPADRPIPQLEAAAAALARLVPDGARFATQRDFPAEITRTGVIHPEIWLARASGRHSLNGFNVESVSTPAAAFEPDQLDDRPPDVSATSLARLGVTHVVTTTDTLADHLSGSERFGVVWRAPPLAILALAPTPEAPIPGSLVHAAAPVEARLLRDAPEHLVLDLHSPRPVTATLALAWSPKWHGRLGGHDLPLGRTKDGLVRVPLPAGPSRLALDYRTDGWDRLGGLLTVVTILSLAGGAALSRLDRHRRRAGYSIRAGRRPS
jgi:hypothetical protein